MIDLLKKRKTKQSNKNKKIKQYEREGYDLDFIAKTQPEGGITFKDRYVETGAGYQGCLLVYDFPNDVPGHWLDKIVNRNGITAVVDCGSEDNENIKSVINRSMREQYSRVLETKSDALSKNEARNTYQNLMQIGDAISQYGEVIRTLNIRLYITEDTVHKLDEKVQSIRKDIQSRGYKCQMMLFESKDNYLCNFYSIKDQKDKLSYYRNGKASVPSSTAGGSFYFNHTELMDERGSYLGYTRTQGPVLLDMFKNDSKRTYYNSIVFGAMGKGKSTLLKMILENEVGRGNMIRGFDVAGDFHQVIKYTGGKMISLNGSGGIINLMEVFATASEEKNNKFVVDERSSFSSHTSKLKMQLKMFNSDLTETDLMDAGNWISSFYKDIGLVEKKGEKIKKITGLPPEKYPILSDFRQYLKGIDTTDFTPERIRSLEKITTTVNSMCDDYGQLFDGHTTIENIIDEQVIFFDIKGLKDFGSRVFQTQVHTAISMIWSHALYHGQIGKQQIENKEKDIEDVQRFLLLIDECHNIINANNPEVVEFTKSFMKEMRKYLAGIMLATQSPEELLPQGNEKIVSDLKQIFELTQYKFLLGMDQSTIDKIRGVLGSTVKSSEYEIIPSLERGDTVLSVAGESIVFHVHPTQDQLDRFKGGV